MKLDKLVTADEAVRVVKSGDWIDYGAYTSMPKSIDRALAKRSKELENVKVRGMLIMKKPEIMAVENVEKHFIWNSWHLGSVERKMVDEGIAYYAPIRYSEICRYYRDLTVDVAMIQVSEIDEEGYFSFGINTAYLKTLCEVAKCVIVEVNKNMPFVNGVDTKIHIDEVDYIVEGDSPELEELINKDISVEEHRVAEHILDLIKSKSCLQFGVGAIPNAVGELIANSDLKDLGVHSEMYIDSIRNIVEAGKITGKYKNIDKYKQSYNFALGSKNLYNYLRDNTDCIAHQVDYMNDIRTISSIDNFVSINGTVDIDLFGQINGESLGTRQLSGSGGQLDYVLGAYLSKGGKSFIACTSTFKNAKGENSRIRPTLQEGSIVTSTRCNVHYFVTEYGAVNLKGLATWQRAEAIINLAHPDFREDLIKEAENMRIWLKSNKK